MKLLRFLAAPVLVLVLIVTSLYLGTVRPGAGRDLASKVVATQGVADQIASSVIDQLINSDDLLLTAVLTTNRKMAEREISRSLQEPEEQQQIAEAFDQIFSSVLDGKRSVEIDSKPIFRPIYQALDAIFPTLNLIAELEDLDPIVVGEETPLPNLRFLRQILSWGLFLWPVWLVLIFFYIRWFGRAGLRSLAIDTLVISGVSTLLTASAPLLIQGLIKNSLVMTFADITLRQLTQGALWISLSFVIASTVILLLTRERVLASQSPTQSE